jgi:hypothetical protein
MRHRLVFRMLGSSDVTISSPRGILKTRAPAAHVHGQPIGIGFGGHQGYIPQKTPPTVPVGEVFCVPS